MANEQEKETAARASLRFIQNGQIVGLGSGSTATRFIKLLGEEVRKGLRIRGIPTSDQSKELAESLGVPLTTLDECQEIAVTVDGADEVDPQLRLIKGGGGALLWEKIVAAASARMVVIADYTKWVAALGHFPLPIEVVPFGLAATRRAVEAAVTTCGCPGPVVQRRTPEGRPFVTDGGHHLLDASLGRIPDPEALAARLAEIPGVVEHGLFIGLASAAILAGPDGVRTVEARTQSRAHRIACKSNQKGQPS